MLRSIPAITCSAALCGCVVINPGEFRMEGSPVPVIVAGPKPSTHESPYTDAVGKVMHQQAEVARELRKQKWSDVLEESEEWIVAVSRLSSYADVSKDPARLRQTCDALSTRIQAVRSAALRADPLRGDEAFAATDPLLSTLSRDFASPAAPTAARRPSASPIP